MSPLAQLNAELLTSIKSADKELLQTILISMCEDSHECLLRASGKLLVSTNSTNVDEGGDDDDEDEDGEDDSEDGDEEEDEDESEESEDAAPSHTSKKQKLDNDDTSSNLTARYRICRICNQTFDVTENSKRACRTHDGEKEIDQEYFPDDDDIQHEPDSIDVDNDWRVKSFPEGFPWSCCGTPADRRGCIAQRHRV